MDRENRKYMFKNREDFFLLFFFFQKNLYPVLLLYTLYPSSAPKSILVDNTDNCKHKYIVNQQKKSDIDFSVVTKQKLKPSPN